jgi:hypothetical protein
MRRYDFSPILSLAGAFTIVAVGLGSQPAAACPVAPATIEGDVQVLAAEASEASEARPKVLIPRQHGPDCTGYATPYHQHGVAGSCGIYHQDSDTIVALAPNFMPAACGRQVHVCHDGQCVTATVRDTCRNCGCTGCHIDMSWGAYKAIGGHEGRTDNVWWNFV